MRRTFVDRILLSLPYQATPMTRIMVRGFVGFVEAASVEFVNNKEGVAREELVKTMVKTLFLSLAKSD